MSYEELLNLVKELCKNGKLSVEDARVIKEAANYIGLGDAKILNIIKNELFNASQMDITKNIEKEKSINYTNLLVNPKTINYKKTKTNKIQFSKVLKYSLLSLVSILVFSAIFFAIHYNKSSKINASVSIVKNKEIVFDGKLYGESKKLRIYNIKAVSSNKIRFKYTILESGSLHKNRIGEIQIIDKTNNYIEFETLGSGELKRTFSKFIITSYDNNDKWIFESNIRKNGF